MIEPYLLVDTSAPLLQIIDELVESFIHLAVLFHEFGIHYLYCLIDHQINRNVELGVLKLNDIAWFYPCWPALVELISVLLFRQRIHDTL